MTTEESSETGTQNVESRTPTFNPSIEYDEIRIHSHSDDLDLNEIWFMKDGRHVAHLRFPGFPVPRHDYLAAIVERYHYGELRTAHWDRNFGLVYEEDIPASLKPWFDMRNPLLRLPLPAPPAPTVTEARREQVSNWARANTTPRQFQRFIIHGAPPGDRATLDQESRSAGQIWWAFVLMTTATAFDDDWIIDDDLVWPALERNIEITAEKFCGPSGGANTSRWYQEAAYMAALSRIYKAPASLTGHPILLNIQPGPLSRLHAASDAAKAIIYGADE